MWMQAVTPVKIINAKGVARIVGPEDEPFEVDDDTGAELVALEAAVEVDAPAAKATRGKR